MVLAHSRHMVVRIVFDQRIETWLRLHAEAFAELGGVVGTVVPDNLKSAVIRAAFGADRPSELNRSPSIQLPTPTTRHVLPGHGWGTKAIAKELGIARNTVKRYVVLGDAAAIQVRPNRRVCSTTWAALTLIGCSMDRRKATRWSSPECSASRATPY
jgi:transposase